MASGEGCGGARASQASWVAGVVGGGPQEAQSRAPPRGAPGLGSGAPAAAERAAGTTVRSAQAPQDTEALDARPEVQLLLLDDIQAEVEVVADVEVVTEEATVPQQDAELGGAHGGEACAWHEALLLLADVVQVVEVVSEEEAVRRQHAAEASGLEEQMMEGLERHGVELSLPLEDMTQLVGALSNRVDVRGWAEWAVSEYGAVEDEGEEYREGQREVLEGHDNIQFIQLGTVPGHMEGWEQRPLSEGGNLEELGEEKDDDDDEEEEDWLRQQEVLEVHEDMHVIQVVSEPGQQEGWEEWALSEDGNPEEEVEEPVEEEDEEEDEEEEEEDEEEDEEEEEEEEDEEEEDEQEEEEEEDEEKDEEEEKEEEEEDEEEEDEQEEEEEEDEEEEEEEDEDEEEEEEEDEEDEEEEDEEEDSERQRQQELLEGHDNRQSIQVMTLSGHREGWEECADTGEPAVDGEEESDGVDARPTVWLEEKPRVLAHVREKALALRRAEPVRAPDSVRPPLEELEALQRNLEPVNELVSRAQSRLKLKILQSWKPLLELRSTLIQCIPGFWAQVFGNHPQMSAMMGEQDANLLSYMTNLQVEDVRHRPDCCRIVLFFASNPYFREKVIAKEYVMNDSGYRASGASPVRRYRHYGREACGRRHRDGRQRQNLLGWMCEPDWAGSGRIAEIIREDLWPNPLRYHVSSEAPEDGSGAEITRGARGTET